VQELRFRRNLILGWGLGLCFFPIVYLGVYPQVAEEMAGLADLEIYQAMGVSVGTFEDWVGSILILFVPLLLAIFAVINGTGTLAGEEEDGRLEMIVTLPLPRWKILTAKAIALSITTFIILLIVSVVSVVVFLGIESQIETDVTAMQVSLGLLSTWPLAFAVAMLSMFLATFCSRRRIGSMIAAVIIVVSYFGNNLGNQVSTLDSVRPLFLFNYLDYSGKAITEGQQAGDILVLIGIGLVAFILALFFFQRRKLTVGAWPWQRSGVEV
jgi:ABC-2 type transport system permease protein